MAEFIRDPDLDRLVHDLNRQETSAEEPASDQREVGTGTALGVLVGEMLERRFSDLILITGAPPACRVDGRIVSLSLEPMDAESLKSMFAPFRSERVNEQLRKRVIVMTAAVTKSAAETFGPVCAIISKPFDIHQLVRVVTACAAVT